MAENPFEPPKTNKNDVTRIVWGRISLTLSLTSFACIGFAAYVGPGAFLCIPGIITGILERSPRGSAARTGIGVGLLTMLYLPTIYLALTR